MSEPRLRDPRTEPREGDVLYRSGRLYLTLETSAPDDCPASYAPPCEPGCDRACPVGGEREPAKEDQDGQFDMSQERYCTWDEAKQGHNKTVAALRNGERLEWFYEAEK